MDFFKFPQPVLTVEEGLSLEMRNALSARILEAIKAVESEKEYHFSRAERDAVFLDILRWNNLEYLRRQYNDNKI